ncbi:FAD-dependent tricarballylate dehydrogenase TcuA [soil metagenome]
MTDYDLIVVGAGNAALAAAVSASENGARVLVLEKAPRNMRGGNTHWSGGLLRFAYGDPRAVEPLLPDAEREIDGFYDGMQPYTPNDFHDDLMRVTNGRTDPVLSRLLVEQSKDTVFWMNRVGGIPMEPATNLAAVRKGKKVVFLRGLVLRAVHEGVGLSTHWFETCEKMGVDIRYDSAVMSLVLDDAGRVTGVKVRDADGISVVTARSIVLGCGGFEANAQMRTQHIGPLLGEAKVRGTPHNQGDGLRMALEIGAMPWGQWSGCHATPISADWGDFAPREMTDRSNRLSYVYSVMLNRAGKRFVDEGENTQLMTYAKFGRAILAQPGAKVWQLFDSSAVPFLEPRYSTSKPITSDTIEGLIAQLDIENKAQAIETVRQYNAAARLQGGTAAADPSAAFDPTKLDGLSTQGLELDKTNWAVPLSKPPFVAYSATGGITFTFGGLRVNEQAEVIGTDWRPIPGLYACGEMVGGLYYDNYPAGTGLVSGATFGRIAGRNAALKTPLLDKPSAGRIAALGDMTEAPPQRAHDASLAGQAEGWVP